jgi:hypothetical protein
MHLNVRLATVGAVSVLALLVSPGAALADHAHGHNLIRSDLTPSKPNFPKINGVAAGGAPWIIGRGHVRVRESGRMDVRIQGLQIPSATGAANPVASIDAVLYCGGMQVADSGPQPMTVPGGDARFRVSLSSVPRHCAMATVLISPSAAVGAVYIASAMADDDRDD